MLPQAYSSQQTISIHVRKPREHDGDCTDQREFCTRIQWAQGLVSPLQNVDGGVEGIYENDNCLAI